MPSRRQQLRNPLPTDAPASLLPTSRKVVSFPFLCLAVIGVASVLAQIMPVVERLRDLPRFWIQRGREIGHSRDGFKNDRVVGRSFHILSPGKGPVVGDQDSWQRGGTAVAKCPQDCGSRVPLVFARDLVLRHRFCPRHWTVEVIPMGGTQTSDSPPPLPPPVSSLALAC